jgi:adenylate cyclase
LTAEHIERRLAAILSADAVGYSRLMAQDETGTIRSLDDHRGRIAGHVRQYRGRVVDAPGDNLLAEFPTALDATLAAIDIQRDIRAANAAVAPERRMEFRIGIHMGDVAAEGNRLFGDGVNIAARLERLAEPGGICISDLVHSQVRRKIRAGYEDLGAQIVKNVPDAVRVFRVRAEEAGEAATPAAAAAPTHRRSPALAAAVVLLLAVGALVLWRGAAPPRPHPGEAATFADRPAIAVLPFDNLSDDSEQEFFADGISEDLTTRLATARSFPVIARNSTFTYKGRAVDVMQVSRELGARYVVEGSVRKAGDRVRINAQLIDAATGHHVWAETYDRELRDVFAVQDEITQAIAGATQEGVLASETERAVHREPSDLSAWQTMLRGMWHFEQQTPEANREAQQLFESALAQDPEFSAAAAGLALTHYSDAVYHWSEDPERSAELALETARHAARLDPAESRSQGALAVAYSLTGDGDAMIAAAERALALNPSSPRAHFIRGWAMGLRGRPDEGNAELALAMRLSPHDPNLWAYLDATAYNHFAAGRYADAIEWERRALDRHPDYSFGELLLAASHGQRGETDAGRAALDAALALQPQLGEADVRRAISVADVDVIERFLAGLRAAGWEG